jgi:hypothetical protein
MNGLVVLDDNAVVRLTYDGRASVSIPCLMNKRDMFRVGGTCGACARKKQEKQLNELAKIKRCIATMADDKKHELKKYLGADKVRIFYANAENKIVQLTF